MVQYHIRKDSVGMEQKMIGEPGKCATLHTFSTSRKTRMKLRPANFLRSSSDQAPLVSSEAKRAGYLDTSSRPTGVLKIHQWTAQQIRRWVKNAQIETFKYDILGEFPTMWIRPLRYFLQERISFRILNFLWPPFTKEFCWGFRSWLTS